MTIHKKFYLSFIALSKDALQRSTVVGFWEGDGRGSEFIEQCEERSKQMLTVFQERGTSFMRLRQGDKLHLFRKGDDIIGLH